MNDFSPEKIAMGSDSKSCFSETEKVATRISDNEVTVRTAESVRRSLSTYDLGRKLRQLRLRKKIALVDLGKHTGLSASMLSQLENGKLIPTLPTLVRIAMVFDVGLEHFFSDSSKRRIFSIVRADERLRFPERADSPYPGYFFEVLTFGATEKSFSSYLAEFPKRDRPESLRHHYHDGAEFVHVLVGELAINYQSEDHILRPGDSVYFDATEPHYYYGQSDEAARAIVVTSQPRL
jgi:transcriptional regulator with XRE-family HTH domain